MTAERTTPYYQDPEDDDTTDPDREWKALLEPFGYARYEFQNAIQAMIREKTDDELAALLAGTFNVNTTNCWFATYDVAPMLSLEIKLEQSTRKMRGIVKPA